MNLITGVVAVISVILNVFLVKLIRESQINIAEKYESIIELEKTKKELNTAIEKNKNIVSEERKALMSQNAEYETKLKTAEVKLEEYTKMKLAYISEMDNLNYSAKEMTPKEFLKVRKEVLEGEGSHDFTGIYILENKTHDKFYVGQSISLHRRAGSHFIGDGNKDIYEDYMKGDEWTVKLIALSNSGFKSINALEKHFIEYHHSTFNGYNKTVGNRN